MENGSSICFRLSEVCDRKLGPREAVSNRNVKKEENCNVWYILDTKSGKNQYFLGVGQTPQGKTPYRPKDVSWEKIDL